MGFRLGPKALGGGYRLAAYDTIGSTSTEALARARSGDPGRLWVVSKAQTAGHGRRGRSWETPAGNLAASLLLANTSPAHAATLGFAAGLALVEAIHKGAPFSSSRWGEAGSARSAGPGEDGCARLDIRDPHPLAYGESASPVPGEEGAVPSAGAISRLRLKWPNDVLLDGAKVAGILLEAVTISGRMTHVAVGIGVNVGHAPQDVSYAATSLAACGIELSAEQLFAALSEAWFEQERAWDGGRGFAAIRSRWLERAAGLGAPIAVRHGSSVWRGAFETIDEEGRLVLRRADGSARTISAGEVHFGAAATTEP